MVFVVFPSGVPGSGGVAGVRCNVVLTSFLHQSQTSHDDTEKRILVFSFSDLVTLENHWLLRDYDV